MVRWSSRLLLCAQVLLLAGPALARPPGDDGDRQQRRMELRQQLEAERERWRADPQRGEGGAMGRGGGYGGPPPGFAPAHGGRPGGGRLSPDERRALRQELREHRP